MINYRNGKARYKVSDLGSLYVDDRKKDSDPIIYIGGQLEHRGHIIEQTGYTADNNHNMYTGSWMYDYPIFGSHKDRISAQNFSEILLASLREAKLNEVVLLTQSYGGLIGAYASKSPLVKKVIAVHPPILGTPLANPKVISDLDKQRKLLTKTQKLITAVMRLAINYNYGFEKDNYNGIDPRCINLNKFTVIGNSLDLSSESSKLMLETYDIIWRVTGKASDGVVILEPDEFEKKGIDFIKTEERLSHLQSSSPEFMKRAISLGMKIK